MARSPYNPVPEVTPGPPASQYENINATPAAFGGLIAGGEEKLGAGEEQAGSNLVEAGLRIAAMNNETAARNGSNQFIEQAGKSWSEYGTKEGKEAVDGYGGFMDGLQKTQKSIADTMPSPMARNAFLNASSYMLNRLSLSASSHAATQQRE